MSNKENDSDIAMIGMSGRFPGANSVNEFWQNLCAGVESISFFSDEELKQSEIDPALLSDPNYVKAAPLLEGSELFDASFFGYSPREAKLMDPQHRLFLECAWEALEHAGYDANRYKGSIGIYAGTAMNTYLLFSGLLADFFIEYLPILIGSDKDFLTSRVSYKLNLTGPSVTVQTACSTSLVAVHLACQSLLNEECDIALAGGVSVRVPHKAGYLYQKGSIFSPDGHCRAFDSKAQGTIFGSGVGIVVLKRLVDAIADRDCIHAVIKGSAINNDGSSKVDYTAPSVNIQSDVVVEALANSEIEADTISYIEAHGTGTALGDPIEIAALTKAFRNYTDKKGFCSIGSVKTNIGHLDAAAGVASLIKTILALKYKMIPRSLHFKKANPEIDFENSPFYVNRTLCEWKSRPYPRRAGVSSLGVGGTNAHIILEEAPTVEVSEKSGRPLQLLLLSAKTNTALEMATTNLAEHLRQHPHLNLTDVAYTLQVGREAFNHRRMVVCRDCDDAVTALETLDKKRVVTSFEEPLNRDIVFLFSGQGSQYVNMGLELYRTESIFRECVDRCSEILQSHLSFELRDILYPDEKSAEEAAQKLKQTFITQPALFVIEYALAKLWMAWGVHPVAMVGHSIGEYVAACLSGVFSLEDALSLVATRGRLMQELPGGSMLAITLSEKEIQPFLGRELSLAVINGPSLCVVSGEEEAIGDLEKQLSNKNVYCRHLHTSHAFHSKMMEPILDAFTEQVKKVGLNPPQIPFLSNVTGTWITPNDAINPNYWTRQLRQTVRFSDCLQELLKEPNRVLLEVGPGHTFSMLARQHPNKTKDQIMLSSTHHPKEKKSDVAFILNTVGRLWLAEIQMDWSGFYKDENRHRVPLPTYPFERKRYWFNAGKQTSADTSTAPSLSVKVERASLSHRTHQDQKTDNTFDGAPRDDVEQSVADIWQDVLGVEQVRIHDNFFDLGGSSLIALHLFNKIEEVFGKNLPLATLFEAPTVDQLACVLREEEWTAPWASLVEIQSGSSKPPFFCIHGAGGNVLIYRDLARHLGPDQPFYGLQSHGLDGEKPYLTRIEDMAALYIKEIQRAQPEGPYLLGGYCMGGTVALEIAQQLCAQDQEVALLVFFETYNWANMRDKSLLDNVYYYMQKIEFHLRNFLLLESKGKLRFIQEKAKVAKSRSKVWYGMILSKFGHMFHQRYGQYLHLAQLRKINDRAPLNYTPKVYPGRITNFCPVKQYALFDGPELGWNKVVAGGVETYELPVFPAGMLVEPFVRLLSEKLQVCIHKALNEN